MSEPPTISVGHTLSGRLSSVQYRVVEQLGAGGVGAVYRATRGDSGESFALKVLHRSHAGSERSRRRFEREAQALEALDHPNIVRIVDYGASGGEPYLVMELLRGESLSDRLRRGPLSASEARQIAGELLDALAYAHSQGLVHRDLKPGNLFLQRRDDGGLCCKLLDFGFVKFITPEEGAGGEPLTRTGEIFGTPAYMAPEQIGSEETTPSTDVYSAGVLLYELVTGKRPFDGEIADVMRGHLVEDPPPFSSSAPSLIACAGLEALLTRALQKRPADRYADAAQMQAAFAVLPEPLFTRDARPSDDTAQRRERDALEQAETLMPAIAGGVMRRARPRPSLAARFAGFLRALFHRVLTASAVVLIVASLLVIVVSGVVIFGLRDTEGPAGTPSPSQLAEQLNTRLRTTSEVLKDKLEAVAPAIAPAIAPAPELDPQPEQVNTTAEANDAEATPGATSALPPARDPFRRAPPAELRPIARAAQEGERGTERMIKRLRAYNRMHPRDARGHLLLARLYYNRGWREDALAQYEAASRVDPSARGAKLMRGHLRALAQHPKTAERATSLLIELYGPDAVKR